MSELNLQSSSCADRRPFESHDPGKLACRRLDSFTGPAQKARKKKAASECSKHVKC
jgi:hypothetical protein